MRQKAQEILAPQFAEILEKTATPFLQSIYDVRSEEIVFGRIALMGDAAFVGRPHVGMGVTKAGDEAIVIAKYITQLGATPAALKAYRDERLKLGQQVVQGEAIATIESFKAASDIHAPISGEIVALNDQMDAAPELINEKPYGVWLFKIKPESKDSLSLELKQLMSLEEYELGPGA
jgi:glycine cleavage system H lipoate-binding protein